MDWEIDMGDIDVLKAVTDTTSLAVVIPEIWSQEIEEARQPNLVMRALAVVNDDLLDKPGDKVHISKEEEVDIIDLAEGDTITPTELTPTELVVFEPSEKGGAVELKRKAVRRSYRKELERATRTLGKGMARKEDLDAITAVIAGADTIIYANGTGDVDIAIDDILTPSLLKDARAELKVADSPGPFNIVLHPQCERSLLEDSQFTDASEFGSAEVVMTGQIGKYLGMPVLETTNLPSVENAGGIDVFPTLVMGQRAFGIALKANPDFTEDYLNLKRTWVIASVAEWQAKILNSDQAVMIRSAGGKGS